MTYFIDFDSTLYNTEMLIDSIIESLAKEVSNHDNHDEVLKFITHEFKVIRVASVFDFCDTLSKKYNVENKTLALAVKDVLADGKKFVYADTIDFLCSLNNHKRVLLTYSTKEGTEYQQLKIEGSGLTKFFDKIIITNNKKCDLDIDYHNSTFVDDSPKAITDIFSKSPKRLIRVNRPNSTYSKIALPQDVITEEVSSLSQISIT